MNALPFAPDRIAAIEALNLGSKLFDALLKILLFFGQFPSWVPSGGFSLWFRISARTLAFKFFWSYGTIAEAHG
jgi:hypothetical protein